MLKPLKNNDDFDWIPLVECPVCGYVTQMPSGYCISISCMEEDDEDDTAT